MFDHNEIINRLCAAGYPAYLVGGAVRDLLVGNDPHDFDIVTKASPDQILEVFDGYHVNTVGKSFGVTLVEGYEVATFRIDQYPNGNGAGNCVPFFADTIHDDLSRRDLTLNALAMCPISGDIIDDHDGISDLNNRVIRFVGNAQDRITEDPNRIVRACRFVAKLEGRFAPDTLRTLQRNVHLMKLVDPERIMIEVKKAMELDKPSIFFAALYVIGALDYVFPGFGLTVEHTHGNHHQENVWEHSMLVGDAISPRFPLVRLAGYLHDSGKPSAFYFHNDGTFVGHETVGSRLVDGWLKRLRFSNQDRETIVNLVSTHMLGGVAGQSDKATRKFIKTLHDLGVYRSDWLRLRIADRKGNLNRHPFTFSEIKARRKLFDFKEKAVFDVNCLSLRGGDIIKIFNLTPGPVIGKLQKHLLEYVVNEGFEYNTQELLIEEAEKFLS